MARKEASLDGHPEHLARFAARLRAARSEANIKYEKLQLLTGYSKSHLSRAANGKSLPSWEVTNAYLKGCGIVGTEMESFRELWERTKVKHQARGEIAAWTQPRPAPDGPLVLPPEPQRLLAFLRGIETKEELIEAIDRLARRAGYDTLRKIEASTGVPRSTLSGWFRGRKPSRLDELVVGLGASAVEQYEFAQCYERIWLQMSPYLVVGDLLYRHSGCYELDLTLADGCITGGSISLAMGLNSIIGIGPGVHDVRAANRIDMAAGEVGATYKIGIWVDSVAAVVDEPIYLHVLLQTTDGEWPQRLRLSFPASTGAVYAPGTPVAPDAASKIWLDDITRSRQPVPEHSGDWR